MKTLKIKKIRIFNFKIFDSIEIDLRDSDVVVFDGPNGFGKTSVFDAVELLLTGQISRLIRKKKDVDLRRTFEDNLLVHNQDHEETYVKAEILLNGVSFFVCRHANWKKHKSNNPTDFSPFSLHLLKDLNTAPDSKNRVDENQMVTIFGENFLQSYPVMHYIEQDESAFLLKRREGDRKEFLSYLFHTVKEEEEYRKIKNSLEIIKSKETELSSSRQVSLNRLKILKDELVSKDIEDVPYKKVIGQKDVLWDKEEILFGLDKWNSIYKPEIISLKYILTNKKLVKQALINNYLTSVADQTRILQYHVTTSHFSKKLKTFQENQENKKYLEGALESLSEIEDLESFEEIEVDDLSDVLGLDEDFVEAMKSKLESLREMKESLDEEEGFYESLEESREQLSNFLDEEIFSKKSDCPLCGHEYEDKAKLLSSIQSVTERYEGHLKKGGLNYRKNLTEFKKKFVEKLISETKKKILALEKSVPTNYYSMLIFDQRTKDGYEKFTLELGRLEINILNYANADMAADKLKVDSLVKDLKGFLQKAIIPVDNEAYSPKYKSILEQYFNNDFQNVNKIALEDLDKKVSYIENEIVKKQSDTISNVEKSIASIGKLLEKCEIVKKSIRDLLKIYESEINTYKSRVISQIEVPFYIYSGRIIQTFNRGSGFIIDIDIEKELKGVRFKANSSTSHDALFSLSSGQLAALVISFMLALNRVYAKNNIILIDDPVQTMDDVNIASLIELLRNDFMSHQVFLSTHEDHISLYMNYKFGITKMNSNSFNMKKIMRSKI